MAIVEAEASVVELGESGALPPFAALRAFDATFRAGGIRKGAASLGVDHAIVSRHIRQLEAWLGVALLRRVGGRVLLTEEGERYHARVSACLAELVLATREAKGVAESGKLRLWCAPALSIQWLSAQIAEFERLHPEFTVELKPSDTPANLLNHEADADIRSHRDDDEAPSVGRGLRVLELAHPVIMAVASPEVAGEFGALAGPADLLNAPLLHEASDEGWRAWFKLNGVQPPPQLKGARCWHAHLAIAGARQGRGVALATRFLVADDIARGELVEIRPQGSRPVTLGRYVLLAREDRWSLPVLKALRHFLQPRAASMAEDAQWATSNRG